MKLKHPIGFYPARSMAAEPSQVSAGSGLAIAVYCQCWLVITLGGEQRQQCKVGRGGRGEARGFPAINYSACRGRAAVAHRSQEQKPRSHFQPPRQPPRPQAAADAAAQDHGGGRGRGGERTRWRTAPALWSDSAPSPAREPYLPPGEPSLGLVPDPDREHR